MSESCNPEFLPIHKHELPHMCVWKEIDHDLENPAHQKELLRGKKLYACDSQECRKEIWLKDKSETLVVGAIDLLGVLNKQMEMLKIQNWDEQMLQTWGPVIKEQEDKIQKEQEDQAE